ncbi:hypothetical protein DFAR_1260002 [Desulfarculales bacterium]
MVRTASLFSQLRITILRTEFAALGKEHGTEVRTKGSLCWTHFVAMLFCHLARADFPRESCSGLSVYPGKLSHFGVSAAPKRSTLPYANQHKPSILFRALFFKTIERFRAKAPWTGKRASSNSRTSS